jgi:hypothetical protein
MSLLCPARHQRARDAPVDIGEAVGLGQVCHVEGLARPLQEVGRAEERGHGASGEAWRIGVCQIEIAFPGERQDLPALSIAGNP